LRGASRYYNPLYAPAFVLECAALRKVRDEMGLDNVQIMIPFVRTLDEARKVIDILNVHGLERGCDGLKVIMMCEVPSNIVLIEEFLTLFDGISIGSNDLTQLMLAVDRDSQIVSDIFDERDSAVMDVMKKAVQAAKRAGKYSGICGQAPSDYPEVAQFLIESGIDSISLNSDSVMQFMVNYKKK
jgi:pyruvate,water dikinase